MTVHFADLALAVLVLEAAWLLAHPRSRAQVGPARAWAFDLLAGACLLLALRLALVDAWWPLWAGALGAAGLAHATQLSLRWGSPRPS